MKAALVTGGSRGIGAAIVKRLVSDGYSVLFCYREAQEAAQSLAHETGALAVRADLTSPSVSGDLVRDAYDRFGRLDCLVNNAASISTVRLPDLTVDQFDREIAVNLRAPAFACQTAFEVMTDGASIVNISSINATIPTPAAPIYSASKAALEALTVALAREAGPRDITVNAVAPGATDTDNLRNSNANFQPFVERTAMGRLGQPNDIASVVSWLASPDARWVTGETIRVSGGFF